MATPSSADLFFDRVATLWALRNLRQAASMALVSAKALRDASFRVASDAKRLSTDGGTKKQPQASLIERSLTIDPAWASAPCASPSMGRRLAPHHHCPPARASSRWTTRQTFRAPTATD